MAEFILLMHDDSESELAAWGPYLTKLQQRGVFDGGSAIGDGACFRKDGAAAPATTSVAGYIRVNANSLDEVRALLVGNPVYEAGGTVEIRELLRSDD